MRGLIYRQDTANTHMSSTVGGGSHSAATAALFGASFSRNCAGRAFTSRSLSRRNVAVHHVLDRASSCAWNRADLWADRRAWGHALVWACPCALSPAFSLATAYASTTRTQTRTDSPVVSPQSGRSTPLTLGASLRVVLRAGLRDARRPVPGVRSGVGMRGRRRAFRGSALGAMNRASLGGATRVCVGDYEAVAIAQYSALSSAHAYACRSADHWAVHDALSRALSYAWCPALNRALSTRNVSRAAGRGEPR